jgi:uncharacterized membrane protein
LLTSFYPKSAERLVLVTPDLMENQMADIFKMAVIGFEAVAVLVLIFGTVAVTGRYIRHWRQKKDRETSYEEFRKGFGRILLLALDLLLAADIILTVTLDLTFKTLGMLGVLVVIRTFLHIFIEMELSGHWPWQEARKQKES